MFEITQRRAFLWLAFSEISPDKLAKLMLNYTPLEIWESADNSTVFKPQFGDAAYKLLIDRRSVATIEKIEAYLAKNEIGYITAADYQYPNSLRQTEVNASPVLFYKGNIDLLSTICFAIVGMRKASRNGLNAAASFASQISSFGYTVVSGMALGIDAAAHEGALSAKANTIAVLGSGLNKPSPNANLHIYRKLINEGLIISEYTPEKDGTKFSFPQRNRIISGLSEGVLVVEAGEKSGSLYTADFALEQGRDIYALPGWINSAYSKGTNELIKQCGAKLTTCAEDIIADLNQKFGKNKSISTQESFLIEQIQLDNNQKKIYNLVAHGVQGFDRLVEESGLSVSELNQVLTTLQIKGLIVSAMAGFEITKQI